MGIGVSAQLYATHDPTYSTGPYIYPHAYYVTGFLRQGLSTNWALIWDRKAHYLSPMYCQDRKLFGQRQRQRGIQNGTKKANAAGLSRRACATRMRPGGKGEVWGKRSSARHLIE